MNELDNLALPHSVEAEQAVLGSMLIDDRCVPDVIARLSPDDFYMRQNRELYQVLYGMFNRFETIDPVTVLDRMKQAGVYDENNSVGYLRQLMEITPTAANVLEYADIVADKALLRRVGEVAGELTELVRQEGGTAQQILEAAEQRIYAIRQGKSSRDLTHIATVMGQVWDTIKDRQASGEEFPGISTGLVDLDRRISGLNNSDLIILAARPGMGKTSLALNIALEAGKHSGKAVAVFSLEMSREQLGMRLISTESLIDNKKLLTGRLSGEEEWTRAALAVATLSQANIYIDDDATLSVADMNAKCRRVKNLGLVVVDYLQLMTSSGGKSYSGETRQQAVSRICELQWESAEAARISVLPNRTKDDVPFELLANCYGQEDIESALQAGASGVGLLRSGYMMLPGRPVDEQEQFVFYQSCIAAAKGGVVTVRTFDFGVDRAMADIHRGLESSKLGLRGIRSSLRQTHQFETQICALLRAAAHGPLRVMFPMVTNLEDWDEAMRLVAHCRQLLRERGEEFDPNTPFGVMFGVPSACLTAEEFVEHGCNFFVIETNDLTQYTHAVDRDISIAERYYRPASHAMKKLIRMVVEAAREGGIPVTICGSAVGNPANTLQYLQLGLRSFSVSPQNLIEVKKALMNAKIK